MKKKKKKERKEKGEIFVSGMLAKKKQWISEKWEERSWTFDGKVIGKNGIRSANGKLVCKSEHLVYLFIYLLICLLLMDNF